MESKTNYPYKGNSVFFEQVKIQLFIAALLLIVLSTMGAFPFLVVPSLLVLFFLVKWFGTDNYPPVILIALSYQWTQISIKVIYSTVTLQSVLEIAEFPNQFILAYLLSSLGLLVLSFGIHFKIRNIAFSQARINAIMMQTNVRKALIGYLVFSLIAIVLYKLRFAVPGLFQAIVALGYIKWALFFVVFYLSYKQQKQLGLLKIIIVIEFISGFASFFADFKTIFFMSVISFLAIKKLRAKNFTQVTVAFTFILCVALIWTAVKMDYRTYLNNDSGTQTVQVDSDKALIYLLDKVGNLSGENILSASTALVDRISYIDYFASCLEYIPKIKAHEDGGLTKNSLMHVLVPRLFNPSKPALDDSRHLTKYTGVFYADGPMGVSFALGYVPDFYIDYGFFGMFIALFIFGVFIGTIIKSIHKSSINDLWSLAVMLPLFLLLYKFENSLIKFFANLVVFWIVIKLFNKYLAVKVFKLIKK